MRKTFLSASAHAPTPRRTDLMRQVAGVGPVEVRQLAALRVGWNGDKATKADVGSVGWLWVDLDPPPGEELEPERARILANLTTNLPKGVPLPFVIIDSGRGFWALWRLREAVVMPPADDPAWDAARAVVEDRSRGLEIAFGADRCHNMERVMAPARHGEPQARRALGARRAGGCIGV